MEEEIPDGERYGRIVIAGFMSECDQLVIKDDVRGLQKLHFRPFKCLIVDLVTAKPLFYLLQGDVWIDMTILLIKHGWSEPPVRLKLQSTISGFGPPLPLPVLPLT